MCCNRTCNNPTPYCGGNRCLGLSVAERSCNNNNSGIGVAIGGARGAIAPPLFKSKGLSPSTFYK